MAQAISVDDVIKRLQDVIAKDNIELKKAIGGAVDLDTVLDRTSIAPMSFHVAYIGSSPVEQQVNANELVELDKEFVIYVVLDTDKFNGRLPQSLIPIVEEQLIHAMFCWDFDLATINNHGPFTYNGDNVEYFDMGRYVHSFRFAVPYTVQFTDDEIYIDNDVTFFDTFIGAFDVGEDDDGNEITSPVEIYNIYNEGQPLN